MLKRFGVHIAVVAAAIGGLAVEVASADPTETKYQGRTEQAVSTGRAVASVLNLDRNPVTRPQKARKASQVPVAPAVPKGVLESIAACESGGNPRAIGGGGAYRGKYQFDMGTWASVGGSGDPAAAPEAEQDARAAMLYARTGGSAWPVCA